MRVAVFVDAGYLYSGGAIAITGSQQNRASMELNQSETIAKLEDLAEERAKGAPLLRIYWYDGLVQGRRSQEQEDLATANNVKVRLGTVTRGQQKGVDSLIVTDLIELARNRAISDAILLSGDEDLRIGVQIAQSFGVRVHLVGIEPSRGNQSNLLREEADTTGELSKKDIGEILSAKSGVQSDPETFPGQAGLLTAETRIEEILGNVATAAVNGIAADELSTVFELMARSSQMIPHHYDGRMLAEGRINLGRDLDGTEKNLIRKLFREKVTSRHTTPPTQ